MDLLGNLANLKVDTVLSAVDKYVPGASSKVKNLADKAKAYVNNVTELEFKVLEATNHEPWGPHGTVMQEITQASFNSEAFYQIMGVLDQRLQESVENWRLVYKSLLLLEYMCKHGPMSVVEALASYSRISHLEKLRDRFEYKDPAGRDQGINVRQRAGALVGLLQDRDRLAEERDKAAKNKSKYTGVSSGSTRYGGFSGGSSSYTSGGFGSSGGSSSFAAGGGGGGGGSGGFSSSSSAAAHGFGDSNYSSGSGGSSRFGAAGGAGGAADGAGGTDAADPVEATRRRIERLKAAGAIADGGGVGGSEAGGGGGLDGAFGDDGQGQRKPKKLSDIKVNPAISATFGGVGLGPPPGAGSRAAAPAAAASSGIDLLGDPADAPPAPAAAGGGLDDWDSFASAAAGGAAGPSGAAAGAAAAAGAGDDWGAFDSVPPAGSTAAAAGSHKKPTVDINSLLGPIPTTSPAASGSKAPLPLDDFCSMPAAAAAAAAPRPPAAADFGSFSAAPAAASGGDPFGPFVAPGGAAAAPAAAAGGGGGFGGTSDPFAASGVVHMVPQASKHHVDTRAKLGPETAKAKDPFADLAVL